MSDLRGSVAPQEVKFPVKNKLIGVVLVAIVISVVASGFLFMSSPSTAAQPLVAHHGPSAPVSSTAQ